MKTQQNRIDEWVNSSVKSNDNFYHPKYPDKKLLALALRGGAIIAHIEGTKDSRIELSINDTSMFKKAEDFKGINPFVDSTINFVAFGLDSIFSYIGFERRKQSIVVDGQDDFEYHYINWNPYFIIDGKKEYYQRGFVWSLEQKQALITTIYRGLEAGRIIVHSHDYNKQAQMVKAGFTDFAARDIVDGKQRLSTCLDFIMDKFPDEYGNYYSDLSESAKRRFGAYQGFMYGEMNESSTPEQIVDVFLNNAVSGTPISKEHIDYMIKIKEILNK